MEDDFDDDAVGMPDDDLTGGGDLGELDLEGEGADVELDLEGGEPSGRPGGAVRARAKASKPAAAHFRDIGKRANMASLQIED